MKSSGKKKIEYIAVSKNKKYKIKDPFGEDVRINKEKADIKVIEEKGYTYILYNNKKYLVEILEKNQNRYTILLNGVSYNFTVETPISYKRKRYLDSQKPKSKVEEVPAPMPGKIVELLVEEGAEVKKGEAILILEAMKMQNEILSTVDGKVKSVQVKAEETVNKDDVLVEISL